nr:hypothetical protein [Tanacetum cinerariifolium]
MATVTVAAISVVAAQRLERMASLSILVSAGILLSAVGFAQPSLTAGALFYLVSSTLALSALFLLAELIERSRSANDISLDEDADQLPKALESLHPVPGTNLDDEQKAVVGHVIPWTMAFLGLSFMACALLIIGLPPLSGFLGKLTLISALLNPLGLDVAKDEAIRGACRAPAAAQRMPADCLAGRLRHCADVQGAGAAALHPGHGPGPARSAAIRAVGESRQADTRACLGGGGGATMKRLFPAPLLSLSLWALAAGPARRPRPGGTGDDLHGRAGHRVVRAGAGSQCPADARVRPGR